MTHAALPIVLLLVLAAELVNGWTDAPNAIATAVGTSSLSWRQALVLATFFNTLGVFSGTAVAMTIGTGIVDPSGISLTTVGAAMLSVIVWSSIAARWGIPTSESHALVAGLAGAGLASAGPAVLLLDGWTKIFVGLLLSSVLGFAMGHGLIQLIGLLCRRMPPTRVRRMFRWLQIASSAFVAFSHGSNDGQKFMGAFTLALVLGGALGSFAIPVWVVVLCAGVMAIGTSIGGFRIVTTLGVRLTKLEPHQGFAAELAAAGTITLASGFGVPLSTTHTIATAIMGVGVANGARAVRWSVARALLTAWVLTFPICGVIGWTAVKLVNDLPMAIQLGALGSAIVLALAVVLRAWVSALRRRRRAPQGA